MQSRKGKGGWGRVVRLAHSASDNINFGCNLESSNNSNSNSSPRENKELNRCERRVKAVASQEGRWGGEWQRRLKAHKNNSEQSRKKAAQNVK